VWGHIIFIRSIINSLIRSFVDSISSTLAALNIGQFGCGLSLRSGGAIDGLITYLSSSLLIENK
jgi:hypothetical protein